MTSPRRGQSAKKSIYLETSVVGAYLDNDEPFRRDLTIRWWEHELSAYEPYVSLHFLGAEHYTK